MPLFEVESRSTTPTYSLDELVIPATAAVKAEITVGTLVGSVIYETSPANGSVTANSDLVFAPGATLERIRVIGINATTARFLINREGTTALLTLFGIGGPLLGYSLFLYSQHGFTEDDTTGWNIGSGFMRTDFTDGTDDEYDVVDGLATGDKFVLVFAPRGSVSRAPSTADVPIISGIELLSVGAKAQNSVVTAQAIGTGAFEKSIDVRLPGSNTWQSALSLTNAAPVKTLAVAQHCQYRVSHVSGATAIVRISG